MNQETANQIKRYKTQIVLLIAIIVSILLSISVLKILIEISKGCTTYKKQANKILFNSRLSAIIVLIAMIYFLFDTIETYKKNQDNASFVFMVSTLLVLIATSLRLINLFTPSSNINVTDDY